MGKGRRGRKKRLRGEKEKRREMSAKKGGRAKKERRSFEMRGKKEFSERGRAKTNLIGTNSSFP